MAYTEPDATIFKMRYPPFAAVDDAVITWWLAYVVGQNVDQGWSPANGPEGQMSAAAHRMVKAGITIAGSDVGGFAAAGVTDFKSGTFSARFSDDAVKQALSTEWSSTPYGADYLAALEKEKGGPRITAPGHVPCSYGYPFHPFPLC